MALPATDNFDRADGALGANWSTNAGVIQISSNAARPASSGNESAVRWNADTFGNDQYARAVVAAVSTGSPMGLAVRCAIAGTANYYGWYGNAGGHGGSELFKVVGGVWTQLGSNRTAFAASDTIRLEITGTTISAKRNTVLQGTTQTDSAHSAGSAGMASYQSSTAARIDNWEGGNLGGAGTLHELAGTATATSSATGALDVVRDLSGVAAASSAASGTLRRNLELGGTGAGTSATSGSLAGALALSGSATAGSAASASLDVQRELSGTAQAGSAATGTLRVAGLGLSGTATAGSAATGTLTVARELAGTATAAASGTAALTALRELAGTGAGTSEASGALTVSGQHPLAGTAVGSSDAIGALSVLRALTGTAAGTSAASGALDQLAALSGTAQASASGTAALSVLRELAGTALGSSAAAGDLTDASTVVTGPGLVTVSTRLTGVIGISTTAAGVAATHQATGNITVQ